MTPVDLVNRIYLNNKSVWHFQRFAYGVKDMTPLFLTCICLDRYIAVVHPIVFTGIRDSRIRINVRMMMWVLILSYGLTKSVSKAMILYDLFSGVILLAFFLMVFCNLSIIWILRKSVAGKETMNPVKKKAFKMMIIVLAIIVTNYIPSVALIPFSSTYTFVDLHCKITVSVYAIMDLSWTLEPLLYVSKMERSALCCCPQSPSGKAGNVTI
ncbi:hypothetical protein E1301_Tti022995 [Triplophysa tibetana]|uniref:G-protein coupled receptors family 1 profile domain-containing protein n=1 Tax=Triplophysa tibetana TaxID=1572043 RepID=A0A5A9NUM9_9TELE|nr:hypothetical protein E1301_Tti022995 [Triplophysa tibetana]